MNLNRKKKLGKQKALEEGIEATLNCLRICIKDKNVKQFDIFFRKLISDSLELLKINRSKSNFIDRVFTTLYSEASLDFFEDIANPLAEDLVNEFNLLHDYGTRLCPTIEELEEKVNLYLSTKVEKIQ